MYKESAKFIERYAVYQDMSGLSNLTEMVPVFDTGAMASRAHLVKITDYIVHDAVSGRKSLSYIISLYFHIPEKPWPGGY